jgi:hypothetical protein
MAEKEENLTTRYAGKNLEECSHSLFLGTIVEFRPEQWFSTYGIK